MIKSQIYLILKYQTKLMGNNLTNCQLINYINLQLFFFMQYLSRQYNKTNQHQRRISLCSQGSLILRHLPNKAEQPFRSKSPMSGQSITSQRKDPTIRLFYGDNNRQNSDEQINEMLLLQQKAKLQLFEQSEQKYDSSQFLLLNNKYLQKNKQSKSLCNQQKQYKKGQNLKQRKIAFSSKMNITNKTQVHIKKQSSSQQNNKLFWRKRRSRNAKFKQSSSPPIKNINLMISNQNSNKLQQHDIVVNLNLESSKDMLKQSKTISKFNTIMKGFYNNGPQLKNIKRNNKKYESNADKVKKKADPYHYIKGKTDHINHHASALTLQPHQNSYSFTLDCRNNPIQELHKKSEQKLCNMNRKGSEQIYNKKIVEFQKYKLAGRQFMLKTQAFKQFSRGIFLSQNKFKSKQILSIGKIKLLQQGSKNKNKKIIINNSQIIVFNPMLNNNDKIYSLEQSAYHHHFKKQLPGSKQLLSTLIKNKEVQQKDLLNHKQIKEKIEFVEPGHSIQAKIKERHNRRRHATVFN